VGGDPAYIVAGKNASAERIAEIRAQMGLDKSLFLQFVDYFKQVVTFEFGRSWSTQQNIMGMISEGIGPSLSLTLPIFILSLIISISIALILLPFKDSLLDKTFMVIALAGMSISSLVFIISFQYFFAYKLSWFPISGWDSGMFERWQYLILPILTSLTYGFGSSILLFRTIFIDEVGQDYIRTAKAKGLSSRSVMFKHLLRNAMIPIITLTVINIPILITGSILLENFFGIPGLGNLMIQAVNSSDLPVIKAIIFILSIGYMVFQLISDLLYAWADPRVQLR
jgi:peptide/nickel transport system permease protein